MNKNIATVVNFARSQLDRHKHLPEGSILGVMLKKREWSDFVEEAERMSAVNAELLAALKEARCWLLPGTAEKNGAKCETKGDMLEMVEAAIARAEQHTNPESQT